MKKTISIALAAMLCVSGAFASEGKTPLITQQIEEKDLGSEHIAQIRKNYIAGQYNEFLKEMDRSYDEAVDKEEVLGLGKMRKGAVDLDRWLEGVKKIKEETNRDLFQAVAGLENRFAQKVRNVATTDGLENLFVAFHQMQPGTGKNSDENSLIALDLEYEYKTIHLDQPKTEISKDLSTKELQYVLRMEQMDKMLLAAQRFEEGSLKDSVLQFAQDFDARLARHWDLIDLREMAREKITDETEMKVATILKSHSEKIQELARNYLADNQ